MYSIIFKEQLRTGSNVTKLPEVSLDDYKIDYNDCVGVGTHGKVYSLIIRPKEEQNFFSYWFPCTYDNYFRNNTINQRTQWCIKIQNSIIDLNEIGNLEWESNLLQQKYRMTNIVFPATYPYFAQIKTRITGNTLQFYLDNNYFLDPEQFLLRKAYVNFQWKLQNVPLKFEDLLMRNIMYDEMTHEMEIVDAYAKETRRKANNSIMFFFGFPKPLQNMLNELDEMASNNIPYTRELDNDLLARANTKPAKPKPYEVHSTRSNKNLFFPYFVKEHIKKEWLQGKNTCGFYFAGLDVKKECTAEEIVDKIIHGKR